MTMKKNHESLEFKLRVKAISFLQICILSAPGAQTKTGSVQENQSINAMEILHYSPVVKPDPVVNYT
jgi:hypothetical protein